MTSLIRLFSRRTMGFKLTVIFLSAILVPMVLLAYTSYRVIDSRLLQEANEKIGMALKAAESEYYARGAQMRYGMLQAASMDELKAAVARRDKAYLKNKMIQWKQMRPYVDVWVITDSTGRVIARLNSDYSGDRVSLVGEMHQALQSGQPVISSEMLGRDMMRFEGNELVEKVAGPGANGAEGAGKGGQNRVMALMVVTPVLDNSHKPIGTIITGDVLNNDDHIPATIAQSTPGVFTTVSMGSKRISTNLTDGSGRLLMDTKLPDKALDGLKAGRSYVGGWTLGGVDYISAFEPINNFKGEEIGSLDVGIKKSALWEVQRENQKLIVMITLLGLSVSLGAALLSTYEITKPLKSLKQKIGAFATGDASVRVDCDPDPSTRDELTVLARTFNSMMEEVGAREAEKQKYLDTIEEKNREFSRLNDELRIKNEEIEVAYEETQSQTEELHAINEELKLLNEDLDRKNAELKKANSTIVKEEEELKKAKDKLRFIYDSIHDFILLVDYDHSILEVNRHFIDTFGKGERVVACRDVFDVLGIEVPPDGSPVRRAIESMSPVEAELVNNAGEVFMWRAYPFLDAQEAPGRAVLYIGDVTEQRMIAQKLMQTDKLSSLGELISGVAHELNNPLTGIMCFSELLLNGDIHEEAKLKLTKINDASHRCKKIIDNLLTFARWKMPEKTYEDVNKIIKESFELRSYQLRVDNIAVEMDLDPELPGTMLDESQMHQVFVNLINNASDAIKEKSGRGWIRVSSEKKGSKIVVKFMDSGNGIPEDVAKRIFDPFFTTKEVGKGTGLGLSISYGIINEHGGNIYVSSAQGKGTTFVIEIPVVPKMENSPKRTDEGANEMLNGKASGLKALILDDEPILLDLLRETLEGSGFRVDKTTSGADAVKMVRNNDYDLIISDIKMPGLAGDVFYEKVKKLKPQLLDKIIFISGDSLNKDTQSFLMESGNYSLKKPFTVDELKAIISKVI